MKTVKLTDICKPKQWSTITAKEMTDSGYPVYGANGVIGFYHAYNHKYPTLLIGCRGSCGNVHICAAESYITGNAMALNALSSDVHLPYLYHFLLYRGFADVISGSSQPQITGQGMAKVLVPLPPLAEQIHIAQVLDKADRLRQQDRQLLTRYDQLVQAVFMDMFGDPVRNEKGWQRAKLADFIDSQRPVTYGILMPGSDDVLDGIPYVRVVDIKKSRVLHEQVKRTTKEISNNYKRSLLIPGDLLISIRGHVGRLAITPKELNGANITQDTARLSINSNFSCSEFVHRCLEHIGMQRIMQRYTKGVAVKGLNLGDLRKIELPLPPLELQKKFAAVIQSLEAQQVATQQLQAQSETLFNSLLQQAFRGELKQPKPTAAPVAGQLAFALE